MGIHILKNFKAQELVDRATYEKFGQDSLRYFRPEILKALDWIHDNYPIARATDNRTIIVNDWYWKGPHEWRGLRFPRCPQYKEWSGHSVGAAIDFSANGCTDEEMRKWILETYSGAHALGQDDHPILGVRRMEIGTVGWTHIDNLSHPGYGILMVNPTPNPERSL